MDDAPTDRTESSEPQDDTALTEELPETGAPEPGEQAAAEQADGPSAPSPTLQPSWWSRSSRLERVRAGMWVVGLIVVALVFGVAMTGVVSLVAIMAMFGAVALLVASLRSERLREALVPFELGALVVACAFAAGLLYDQASDRGDAWDFAYVGLIVGGIVVLALSFARPLVRDRRGERLVLGGIVVLAIAFVTLAIPVLGLLDGSGDFAYPVDAQSSAALAARYTDDGGVRLGQVYDGGAVRPLATGYDGGCFDVVSCPGAVDPAIGVAVDSTYATGADVASPDAPSASGAAVAVPAPAAPADVVGAAPSVASALSVTDPNLGAVAATPPPTTLSLEQAPSGDLRLRITPSILAGVPSGVRVQVRSGSCSELAGKVLSSTVLTAKQQSSTQDILLPVDLGDDALRFDRPLVAIIGVDEQLGATRCSSLVSSNGLALVRSGGAAFGKECIAPLRLRPADRANLAPSSFQSPDCARRFDKLRSIAAASIVAGAARVDQYRACMAGSGQVMVGDIDLGDDYHALPQPLTDDPQLLSVHGGCVPPPNAPGIAVDPGGPAADPTSVLIDGRNYPRDEASLRICGEDPVCSEDLGGESAAEIAEKIR